MLPQILKATHSSPNPGGLGRGASLYENILQYGASKNVEFAKGTLAVLGVAESRNSECSGAAQSPEAIRGYLYGLSGFPDTKPIVDLGNISETKSPADTYAALVLVAEWALEQEMVLLVLGGTQELTLPIYKAMHSAAQPVTISIIDSRIDLEPNSNDFSPLCFLNELISEPRQRLQCINHIGHQSYLCNQQALSILEAHHHELYRLGYLRGALQEVEPVFRNSQLVSFDLGGIRQCDCPSAHRPSPNGLYAEEACHLARFAGLSHSTQIFGLFNLNSNLDPTGQGAHMAAQVAWHFLDGFYSRKGNPPHAGLGKWKRFYVKSPIPNVNLVFLKNAASEAWWMEIPQGDGKKTHPSLVACSAGDYKKAVKGDVPGRWLRAIKRYV